MKVKDIVSVMGFSRIRIYETETGKRCRSADNSWCDHQCEDCPDYMPYAKPITLFEGCADDTPIKYADRSVSNLYAAGTGKGPVLIVGVE